ncbi:MAG: Magnesium transporter MgtE [Chlamydiae bacterium]|nr:Magnesium transporter MgtE [Chlamydiota bacterium]
MERDLLVPIAPSPERKESKTSQLDDLLIEKLEQTLHKPTQAVVTHDVAKIAAEHSAVDLAIVASCLPPHARAILFQNFTCIEEKIKFMINTDSSTRTAVFREVGDNEVAQLIESMPPDEAVEVLEDLSERRYRKVIESIEPTKAMRIKEIEKNARNTAGRLMTNEFFAFQMDVTIGEVASTIRNYPGIDLTSRIFVLNHEGELQGYVPARTLIVNPPELPIKQVMRSVLHKVTEEVPREEVADIVERYKISALPVVDGDDRLVGVITYEDVLDALEDILDETIGSVAGTREKVGENESAMRRFLSRAPWLFVTLLAGLINVGVMSSFENFENGMLTFVLFFVPLITGMSGNIGIQCSTVLVRSMALGLISPGRRKEAIFKELRTGASAGLVFGVLCGLLVYMMDFVGVSGITANPLAIGLIVSVGLFGACLTGTLLGVLSPFFFHRVGVDPAVAAGPIVTAFNDFLSMTIYFLIAVGISSLVF